MASLDDTASIAAIGDRIGRACELHLVTAFRRLVRGPAAEDHENFLRLLTGEPHPLANFALVVDGDDPQVTRTAIEPLLTCGQPSAVIYPQPTIGAEVERCLEAEGYAVGERMPAMAIDIEKLAETSLPDGYTYERIGDDRAEEWTEAMADGYGVPFGAARYFSPLAIGADPADDAAAQFFAITHEQRIVCTSLVLLADGLAGIYCVATLPEHRRKGLGAHATAEPLRAARRLGYGVGVLQSSEEGHAVYKRIGFQVFGEVPVYVRMPG